MIIVNLCDKKFNYEFEKLARLFLPFERIDVLNEEKADADAVLESLKENGRFLLSANLFINGKKECETDYISENEKDFKKECERKLSVCLFKCFCNVTGYKPPWGILTGVRPAGLFSRTVKEKGLEEAKRHFLEKLYVSSEKISLCEETYKKEESIIARSNGNDFSLYISVPFCPSRCSYCSFVSHSVESAAKLIPCYVDYLCKELEITAQKAKESGLNLKTVYMGGGTPTTLSAEQLKKVFDTLKSNFDLSDVLEFTVEAGRPDTVTREKLLAIKDAGATRISINPQTLNDAVLSAIGRKHTAAQFTEAFSLARECGFQNINTDLIAGLPTDTFESFKETLSKIENLSPESVTVHALSMKRASTLNKLERFTEIKESKTALLSVEYAREFLKGKGINPYYMYRQSKTVGNLENVGYAKDGYEGMYNVYIMDETHSILGVGASAVTKLKDKNTGEIKRIFNYKYPYEYINRFSEQIKRKEEISLFYADNT